MNERIQELADRIWAEEYWTNPNTDRLLPAQLNKFAELIVRECANLVDDWEMYQTFTSHQIHGFMPPIGGSKKLKEHFGVEE